MIDLYRYGRAAIAVMMMLCATPIQAFAAEQGAAAGKSPQPAFPPPGEYMGTDTCSDCHEGYEEQMAQDRHGQTRDRRTPMSAEGCESCHGPAEKHLEIAMDRGEGGGLIGFSGESPESRETGNRMCLQCHASGSLAHWQSGVHAAETLACTGCHRIHRPDPQLDRATQSDVCLDCHTGIRADIYRASTHPVREGNLVCTDCHNAHGSVGPAALRETSVNENCYRCHAEKRGPFLWEHYPVSEDCSLCHRVHGSNHAALLNKSAPFLCQQCHQDVRLEGRNHVRRFFDYDFSDSTRRSRFVLGESCMNCHSQVHGSNHPSGAALMR